MRSTLQRDQLDLSTKLDRVKLRSQLDANTVFNNLGHIIDLEMLRQCFNSLDGKKATGIDGITKEEYGKNLDQRLQELLLKIRRGSYHPNVSRIVEIPKSDGSTRPLAISCLEDKIVQEAVRKILEAIYEPLFLDCSHGFRPNRGCDTALVELNNYLFPFDCGAVLDIDLKQYFNTIPHKPLESFLRQKISDERFLRLILKLMKAPTQNKEGKVVHNELGVPQGSILSTVLSNLYLHYVLDLWFVEVNEQLFGGKNRMVRYCDDAIFVLRNTNEANQLLNLLSERLKGFGVTLNLDKTKVIACGPNEAARCAATNLPMPSFTFLGFLHIWGKSTSRKTGKPFWRVKRRTCPRRFRKKLKEVKQHIAKRRHDKTLIPDVIRVVRGYLGYFAINDNMKRCRQFLFEVRRLLFKYLNRRSQKKGITWQKFLEIIDKWGFPINPTPRYLFYNLSHTKSI